MKLDYTPFIVFGTSKSGTTWLQKILNANPEVSCLFQRPIFPLNKLKKQLFHPAIGVYNSKKTPFSGLFKNAKDEEEYNYELKLLSSVFNKYIENMPDEGSNLFGSFRYYYRKFVDSIIKVEGKKACGTKSYSDLDLFLKVFPEGKIITIVRDPRDVIVSKRFHTHRMGAYYLGDEKSFLLRTLNKIPVFRRLIKSRLNKYLQIVTEKSFDIYKNDKLHICNEALIKYATEWVKVNEYILEIEKKHPGKVLRIKYENLKDNFEDTVRVLFKFLDIDYSNLIIDKIKYSTRMPKYKTKNSFYRKGQKGDWINHLDEKQLNLIKDITEVTSIKLNY